MKRASGGKGLPRSIAVVHLPALAGSPGAADLHPADALDRAGERAIKEAKLLAAAGFDGIILENFGDLPFLKSGVPPECVASMGVIAAAVREIVDVPIGINILRNDFRAALGIAAVTGSEFVRTNVWSGVAATDQGWIEGVAAEGIRARQALCPDVKIMADVLVKHAVTVSSRSLALAIEETALRALADAVIVSGATTGRAPEVADVKAAHAVARHCGVPLYLGSGLTLENLATLAPHLDGWIVSSCLRQGGEPGATLDSKRLAAFAKASRKKSKSRSKSR